MYFQIIPHLRPFEKNANAKNANATPPVIYYEVANVEF